MALSHNFTWIMQHFMQWSMQGYETVLGVFVWPLIFTAVVGYVYMKQQSAVAAAIATLIIFAAFINALLGVDTWRNIMYIFTALAITALFLIFFTKVRR